MLILCLKEHYHRYLLLLQALMFNPPTTQPPFNAALLANSSVLKFGAGCPPETAIYVHGWSRNETEADEEFNRI
jgi:hypothetical protein